MGVWGRLASVPRSCLVLLYSRNSLWQRHSIAQHGLTLSDEPGGIWE